MNEKLRYRRQFLLTRAPIRRLADWRCINLGQYYLYAHPDLEVNHLTGPEKTVALLGDIYNPKEPQKGNREILDDILAGSEGVEGLISEIKSCAGCFAIIFINSNSAVALHDARGLREIYYSTESNQIICGSQPNLIAEFSNPSVLPSENKNLYDFYKTYLWDSRWVGDETYFSGIKHLLPNHYFDIDKREVCRYWPKELVKRLRLEDAVLESISFLGGMLKAIVHRHSTMMGVTAGTDSRILLAASREVQSKIYYFINNYNLGHTHPDIAVPERMFKHIGLPFHVHDVPSEVDQEFRRQFFGNTFLATESILPSIYNVFFRNHGSRVLILGVSEIGRTFYGKAPKHLSSYRMAYKLGYTECRYVIKQCEEVAPELLSTAKKFSVNVMALLYWEQRLGNWGAVRNSESLLAIEKIDPFNSHMLYEIFLGVDEKYRNYQETPCIFFREIIRSMWPDLLQWPINPPYTTRDKLISYLVQLGLYEPLAELRYHASYIKHRCKEMMTTR